MYYCLKNRSLVDGLRELRDVDDYVRFLDVGFNDDDNQINVYIDDYHEPLLDWIEEEKTEEWDSGTETYEDDVDSKNLIPERGIEDEAGDKVQPYITARRISNLSSSDSPRNPNPQDGCSNEDLEASRGSARGTQRVVSGLGESDEFPCSFQMGEELVELSAQLDDELPSSRGGCWPTNEEYLEDNCLYDNLSWFGSGIVPSYRLKDADDDYRLKDTDDDYRLKHTNDIVWPRFSYRKMAEVVRKDYGLKVSLGQCRNAEYFALDEISGNLDICRGELLTFVGRDANNQMYPLAWVVVLVENKETWMWFIDLLLEDIEMGDGRGLTIISDQHKGLMEAVKERAPSCEYRNCARHIFSNFKKKGLTGFELRRYWDVVLSGDQEYEVKLAHKVYAIHLERKTCCCRAWQISGIPCVHAIAAILYLNGNAEDYVVVWFKTSMFGSCYMYHVKPINGANMCHDVLCDPILPPRRRRMPGRHKVNRRKCPTENEGRHTIDNTGMSIARCSKYHQEGHNRRRCPLLTEVTVGEDGDVEEGVGEEAVGEEAVGEEGVVEEGDVKKGVAEEGVVEDGVGVEGAIEKGDIEDQQEDEIDHQEDEIDHQEDEIDHQEDHVEDHQENHVEDHQDHV
uniref:SWIM-type domain-containing protein n=1 Tax=Lactuca sativa TaxID=4236 RepID=A0A9R1XBQ8_LACSA|nr:hypothetical protein LSAT_V11C500248030 [Lactuca sativa]